MLKAYPKFKQFNYLNSICQTNLMLYQTDIISTGEFNESFPFATDTYYNIFLNYLMFFLMQIIQLKNPY